MIATPPTAASRRARVAAAARWDGHPSIQVRLDSLTIPQARLVRALIAAAREQNAEQAVFD